MLTSQNPTGIDPTEAQWRELSEIVKEKKHFPFFDMVRLVSSCGPWTAAGSGRMKPQGRHEREY